MTTKNTYVSILDAIANTPEQAGNMRIRLELMQQIAATVKDSAWTQTEAAKQYGVTQSCINDLSRARVSRFSLYMLVNIATAIVRRMRVEQVCA
jgi:predicted XRE-type DNA-binding protein